MSNQPVPNNFGHIRPTTKNLAGRRFDKWLVLHFHSYNKRNEPTWLCRCDCGTERAVSGSNLKYGISTSCRCDTKSKKHGLSNHRMYQVWEGMIQRCTNPKATDFDSYGGRGICVCTRWLDFQNFYNDMKIGHENNLKLERVDNEGNYEPNNCKWATQKQQMGNRRNTIRLTINGLTETVDKWAALSGTNRKTITTRYFRGYPHNECVYGKNIQKLN